MQEMDGLKVCWVGGTRYTRPLNPTLEAKWQALAEMGADIYIVGFSAGMRPRYFQQHAHFYLLPELPISIVRYFEMFLIAPVVVLWIVSRHDVSVIVTQSPFEGAIGAFVKQVAGLFGRRVALAVESHADFEVALFTQRRVRFAGLMRGLMNRAARYAFRHADALRAVSDSAREQLEDWSPGTPIVQFMTWVDVDAFGTVTREKPLSQSHDLVCAAVLIPRKGQHILLDAFSQVAEEVPEAHLWLVGKAENVAYAAQLRQQMERLGLNDRVTLVGAVSQQELAGYMARSRALVLDSSSEGLPRVVVEAMFSGLAVIASNVSGTPQVIEDGVTGYLIPPEDVPALVDALRAMYNNPHIDEMGARAAVFVRQFFSREAYVDGYRRLIITAMNQNRNNPHSAKNIIHASADSERTGRR